MKHRINDDLLKSKCVWHPTNSLLQSKTGLEQRNRIKEESPRANSMYNNFSTLILIILHRYQNQELSAKHEQFEILLLPPAERELSNKICLTASPDDFKACKNNERKPSATHLT